ncbi:hypothetical protein KKF84_06390, partial [Myxococcota bacterium]|nr:hypothetical protein [Myxococcota bacterium]
MSGPLDFRKSPADDPAPRGESPWYVEWFLPVESETGPVYFGGRVVFAVLLALYTWKLARAPLSGMTIMGAWIHLVNLPFHEAGHIFFRPLGRLWTSAGGSIMQLLVPLVILVAFLWKMRNGFGAAVAFWWFGQNFVDLAPYINDARAMTLPLIGGNTGQTAPYGFHDWNFILTELNMVHRDQSLARGAFSAGVVIMVLAL